MVSDHITVAQKRRLQLPAHNNILTWEPFKVSTEVMLRIQAFWVVRLSGRVIGSTLVTGIQGKKQ